MFRNNCAQCHGAGAAGVQGQGFPSLLDNDWLWGGTIDAIAYTVTNGVRNEQAPDARWTEMPVFGEQLTAEEIQQLVAHVSTISGQEADATAAAAGAVLFADNCAVCHGEGGEGNHDLGAPTLTDAIWLYGGDPETLTQTITYARFGIMPAWSAEWRGASGLDPRRNQRGGGLCPPAWRRRIAAPDPLPGEPPSWFVQLQAAPETGPLFS